MYFSPGSRQPRCGGQIDAATLFLYENIFGNEFWLCSIYKHRKRAGADAKKYVRNTIRFACFFRLFIFTNRIGIPTF